MFLFIRCRYMSICDTPTTTGTLDVKPNIVVPTQPLKNAVTPSAGLAAAGPVDVKPLIASKYPRVLSPTMTKGPSPM